MNDEINENESRISRATLPANDAEKGSAIGTDNHLFMHTVPEIGLVPVKVEMACAAVAHKIPADRAHRHVGTARDGATLVALVVAVLELDVAIPVLKPSRASPIAAG